MRDCTNSNERREQSTFNAVLKTGRNAAGRLPKITSGFCQGKQPRTGQFWLCQFPHGTTGSSNDALGGRKESGEM